MPNNETGVEEVNNVISFGEGGSVMADLRNVEGASFEVIPKGRYPGIISDVTYGLSKSNQPMWTCTLDLTAEGYAGRKLFTYISFSPKAMPFTKTTLERIAPELLEGPIDITNVETINVLLGRNVIIAVDVQKYEGEDRNQVKGLYAAKGMEDFMEAMN